MQKGLGAGCTSVLGVQPPQWELLLYIPFRVLSRQKYSRKYCCVLELVPLT